MIKEESIRDLAKDEELNEIRKRDVARLLDKEKFIEVNCPACRSNKYNSVFQKDTFDFRICRACKTVFVNPRPSEEDMGRYYREAEMPSRYAEMVNAKAENRKELIYKKRAESVISIVEKYFPEKKEIYILEIGGGTGGFLEVLRGKRPCWSYTSIEPEKTSAKLIREKGFEVINDTIENIDKSKISRVDIVLSFELIEHIYDPYKFLQKIYEILPVGGLFILTTPNYYGFDFLAIGEGYKNVGAPDHLNYFNTTSIGILLKRANFDVSDVSTPGSMDVDLVRSYFRESKNTGNRFLDFLLYEADETQLDELQDFLSKNRLSGHMFVVARKPK